jgi:hypothetical protein
MLRLPLGQQPHGWIIAIRTIALMRTIATAAAEAAEAEPPAQGQEALVIQERRLRKE